MFFPDSIMQRQRQRVDRLGNARTMTDANMALRGGEITEDKKADSCAVGQAKNSGGVAKALSEGAVSVDVVVVAHTRPADRRNNAESCQGGQHGASLSLRGQFFQLADTGLVSGAASSAATTPHFVLLDIAAHVLS